METGSDVGSTFAVPVSRSGLDDVMVSAVSGAGPVVGSEELLNVVSVDCRTSLVSSGVELDVPGLAVGTIGWVGSLVLGVEVVADGTVPLGWGSAEHPARAASAKHTRTRGNDEK